MCKFESSQKDESRGLSSWLIPRKPTGNLELLIVREGTGTLVSQ